MKLAIASILIAIAAPGIVTVHAGEEGDPFIVIVIKGASPQSHPVADLPSRFLNEGDTLYLNSTWLMIPESELQVKHLKTGKTATITGPAHFTVRENSIEIYEKPTLEFSGSSGN